MNIKNMAVKAKNFVTSHPIEIALTVTSFAAGIAATTFYYENDFTHTVHFAAKKDQLRRVVNEGGCIVFEDYLGRDYALINSPF